MARSVIPGLIRALLAGALGALAAILFWLWAFRVVVPSPEANAVLTEWLNSSCAIGEQNHAEEDIRRFGGELETPFINLFEQGPAAAEIAQVENDARRQFERVRTLIQSGYPTGLPADAVKALQQASLEEFVKRAREDYIDSRKSAALAGLRLTGGRKGRRLLERIATDPKSPYQDLARLRRQENPAPTN
jgi:hypothetical protein